MNKNKKVSAPTAVLLFFFFTEPEELRLYLQYEYLKNSDLVRILKGFDNLYSEILKVIGKYEIVHPKTQELLTFCLTISELKTGNSIDFGFKKTWETKKKNKIGEEVKITNEINASFSIGLKEVVAFLIILGFVNSPNKKINSFDEVDRKKIQELRERVSQNPIWLMLQDTSKNDYLFIEDKAKAISTFFIKNENIYNVKIENVNLNCDRK